MKLQVVGMNHVSAPVALREQAGLSAEVITEGYRSLARMQPDMGVVVLSTCNRTEFYVAGDFSLADILTRWEQWSGLERGRFTDSLYWHQDQQAIHHLFQVASGLDSMILGEPEILGQVKTAYQMAQDAGVAGALHRLFQTALKVGKRARSETAVGQNALSTGHVVVELAQRVFGSVDDLGVMILGAGDMAELLARHFRSAGVSRLMVLNRSLDRGRTLADKVDGEAYPLTALDTLLASADVVVGATKSQDILVSEAMARQAFRESPHRLRFFFDLGVPRNIAPEVRRAGREVFVYDVDDIRSVVARNQAERQREVEAVDVIVQEESIRFHEAMGVTNLGPVIRSLRQRAEDIRVGEMARVMGKLNHLDDRDRDLIEQASRAMVNKILNDPLVSLRKWAGSADQSRVDMVLDLFDLRPEAGSSAPGTVTNDRVGSPG